MIVTNVISRMSSVTTAGLKTSGSPVTLQGLLLWRWKTVVTLKTVLISWMVFVSEAPGSPLSLLKVAVTVTGEVATVTEEAAAVIVIEEMTLKPSATTAMASVTTLGIVPMRETGESATTAEKQGIK